MARIHFVLLSEGSSDEGLIGPLENICIDAGATEVTGTAPDFSRLRERIGHTVFQRLQAAAQLEPSANLFFIHRDSDATDPTPRHDEIATAAASAHLTVPWVAVVPIQELEAWLLLDEKRIREVAANPNGKAALKLPAAAKIEKVASPKEHLKAALAIASGLTGRRLRKFKRDFPVQRRLLLQSLPVSGAINQLTAWARLRSDVDSIVTHI